MVKEIEALYDGLVFRPTEKLNLKLNTRAKLLVEFELSDEASPVSFLDTALSLKLDGPPDWSSRIEDYLNGERRTVEPLKH